LLDQSQIINEETSLSIDAKSALIDKIKKNMAKAYEINISAIEYHSFTIYGELKYVGFSVHGLKEGFGREYEKICHRSLSYQYRLRIENTADPVSFFPHYFFRM
jgi:hypothetical protein